MDGETKGDADRFQVFQGFFSRPFPWTSGIAEALFQVHLKKTVRVPFDFPDSRHAIIKGEYGRYSVHLGSGVVHKQPGGSLCIVPVNAQHRGRLFLPFADDDPRTAEVIAKVLLLARDKEIQDPTILEQIVVQ
jgi:hypothetical protein